MILQEFSISNNYFYSAFDSVLQAFIRIIFIYFFLCACLLIFFDFPQSDWLQQRTAFYDILTVVQKCYFFKTDQGVELIVELE